MLRLGYIGLVKVEIQLFLFVTWPRYRRFTRLCGWGPFILSHHSTKFGVHRLYAARNNDVSNISSNSNSNAEVPMPRFTNGPNKLRIVALYMKRWLHKVQYSLRHLILYKSNMPIVRICYLLFSMRRLKIFFLSFKWSNSF